MIRTLIVAAATAVLGCSHVDSQASRATGGPAVLRSVTVDQVTAPILAAGKYETATFALG